MILVHAFITKPEQNRYEVVALNEHNYVVIDHELDKIYQKFVEINEGPIEFTELDLPR